MSTSKLRKTSKKSVQIVDVLRRLIAQVKTFEQDVALKSNERNELEDYKEVTESLGLEFSEIDNRRLSTGAQNLKSFVRAQDNKVQKLNLQLNQAYKEIEALKRWRSLAKELYGMAQTTISKKKEDPFSSLLIIANEYQRVTREFGLDEEHKS